MPFILSLLCVKGGDTALRFIAVAFVAQLIFIISIALFPTAELAQLCFAILSTVLIALSTKRRSNDAKHYAHWIWALPASIFVFSVSYIYCSDIIPLWLTILPALVTLISLKLPSHYQNHIMGYIGPVDLSCYQTQTNTRYSRVEPSINGSAAMEVPTAFERSPVTSNNSEQSYSTVKLTMPKLLSQANFSPKAKLATLIIATASIIFTLVLIFSSAPENSESKDSLSEKRLSIENEQTPRIHQLTLPDNFSLYLNANNALTISWQTDEVQEQKTLWDQRIAIGDKSCKDISFNNGKTLRTLAVTNEQSALFATFSPLDTQTLVQLIAFKSSFKLCGYSFSLKGSQAALGKHQAYAQYVEY